VRREVPTRKFAACAAALLICLTGCRAGEISPLKASYLSCAKSKEDFAASSHRAYESFKKRNAASLRASLEKIRDTRAKEARFSDTSSPLLIWEEGDRFPSVLRDDGSRLRLTPILMRHQASSVVRVATSATVKRLAVIAQTRAASRQKLLIIDTKNGKESEIDIDAYDALWLDDSTLLISERFNYEPRAISSLLVGESTRRVISATEPGEVLLLRPSGKEGYGLIEHSHPEWSFFELIDSSSPDRPKVITSRSTPGKTCSILEDSVYCSSFTSAPNGSISRMALRGRHIPQTVYVESPNGAISHLAPCGDGLAVFVSRGTYSSVSVISTTGTIVKAQMSGGPTTTLVPSPRRPDPHHLWITRRSFLIPDENIALDKALDWSQPRRSPFCESCAERSLVAVSEDGTSIPISLVTPAHPRALLINVYGSYGVSSQARFTPENISLLEADIAIAIVHVRGGGEFGPLWHSRARGAEKTRSVADLAASISELSRLLALPHQRIVLSGRSAGAWLTAKTASAYPRMIGGLILDAPLLALEKVIPDKTLPLSERERHEWGESPDALRALSPIPTLQNISIDLLAQVPLQDELVPPEHTLRWLSDFQCQQSQRFQTIVSLVPGAGHGGPASQSAIDEWNAVQEAFIKNVIDREL
jgi:protease II